MRKAFILILICMSLLVLSSCKEKTIAGQIGSEAWATMPALTYGSMENAQLAVLDWNCGRLEATSDHRMVESSNGYYYLSMGRIFYADKADLSVWVPVCSKPDCDHLSVDCRALASSNSIAAQNGRLYFSDMGNLSDSAYAGSYIVSTAADGTDKQLAYAIDDMFLAEENMTRDFIFDGAWLYYLQTIDTQGNTIQTLYRITEMGMHSVDAPLNAPTTGPYTAKSIFLLRGDPYLYWNALSDTKLLRYDNEQLIESIEISRLPKDGGYISGNIMREFVNGDGYYDTNLQTGERTKVSEVRLKAGGSVILLPNCVVESTLFDRARTKDIEAALEIFDGQNWHTVQIPDEFQNAEQGNFLTVLGIGSDGILFAWQNMKTMSMYTEIYRVALDSDNWTLEYSGTVRFP